MSFRKTSENRKFICRSLRLSSRKRNMRKRPSTRRRRGSHKKIRKCNTKLAEVDEELAETKALLANAEMAKTGVKETGSFGPMIGTGRCSTLLSQTMNTDGRVCLSGNIVNALVNTPIRVTANPTMDRETTETLEQLDGFVQNEFVWTVDSMTGETVRERKSRFLKQLDWRVYFEEKQLKRILEAWKLKWDQVPGDLRSRHISPCFPKIIIPVKTRYELGETAKNEQGDRTGLTTEQEKEKAEKKCMIRANQLAKLWRKLGSSFNRREEKRSSNLFWKKFTNIITCREEKRGCGKELERFTNIFQLHKTNTPERVQTPKTMQDAPRGKKKIKKQWFVIPVREATFKSDEESGEKQFGTSGKGHFFTVSFFGRLEIQENKR